VRDAEADADADLERRREADRERVGDAVRAYRPLPDCAYDRDDERRRCRASFRECDLPFGRERDLE